ncbi:MAG: hypothetical protein JNM93_12190 [Bacteriovoracaceae bacterium]|nr:hypothetical protein [Bacteriovoracaceae bacterium]
MKSLVLLFLIYILGSVSLQAKENMLHCLAREEANFHKNGYKYRGFYFLNQEIMGNLILLKEVNFQTLTLNAVCSENEKNPSLRLLEHLMLYRENCFVISDELGVSDAALQKILIDEFLQQLPSLLHDFISHMNASTASAECLEKHIPGITKFYEQSKYIREHVEAEQIIQEDNQGIQILGGFHKIDEIVKTCQVEAERKKKSEEKKAKSKR